jgi:hypothetical protein
MGSELDLTPDEQVILNESLRNEDLILDLHHYRKDVAESVRKLGRLASATANLQTEWASLLVDERNTVIVELARVVSERDSLQPLRALLKDPWALEVLISLLAEVATEVVSDPFARRGRPVRVPGSAMLAQTLTAIWEARGNRVEIGTLEYMGDEREPSPFLAFVAHHLRARHGGLRFVPDNSSKGDWTPLPERDALKHAKSVLEALRKNRAANAQV